MIAHMPPTPSPTPSVVREYRGDVYGSARDVVLHIDGQRGVREHVVVVDNGHVRDVTFRGDYTQQLASYIPRGKHVYWEVEVYVPRHEHAPKVFVTTSKDIVRH